MSGRSEQLLLELPVRCALGRQDFFVSAANEQAVAAIDRWPDWSNPVLILSGPQGSGKTHLSCVWQQLSGATIATPQDLVIDNLPGFLSGPGLIIENLEPGTFDADRETALFHLINMVREQKKFLLLTSKQPAAQWQIKLPDLKSRLAAAGHAHISEPDDALLRAILIKQFADHQLSIDESIISYMISRMERSAAAARALVRKIDEEALRQKANVTRPFVSGIMNQQLNLPDM